MILIETNKKKKKTSKSKKIDQDQHKKQKINETSNGNTVEPVPDNQWTEKLRCSNKTTYLTNSHGPYSTPDSKDILHQPGEEQNSIKAPTNTDPSMNSDVDIPDQIPTHRNILVGPDFQATVPDWTGIISESDPKWLGTRMWAGDSGESKSPVGLDICSCSCHFPNSIECFRFHIAEKRFKLKRELGVLFYHWRFDRMGEEVSLSWTRDEEGIFKDLMKLYFMNLPKKFWNNAYKLLPTKRREDLVSYYFNVFVIQRRSYQNRVTPNDIDSDDDERECGVIGDSFGYKALSGLAFEPPSCTLNKQPTELQ